MWQAMHFDGLIRRCVLGKHKKKQGIYLLTDLTNLDDILDERWYIGASILLEIFDMSN